MADSHRVTAATTVAGILLVISFGLLALGKTSVVALLAGIVVLDIGTQGMQITNQAVIYTLRPDARSRINSAYMVCYFVGGALGSLTRRCRVLRRRLERACVSSAPASGPPPSSCRRGIGSVPHRRSTTATPSSPA